VRYTLAKGQHLLDDYINRLEEVNSYEFYSRVLPKILERTSRSHHDTRPAGTEVRQYDESSLERDPYHSSFGRRNRYSTRALPLTPLHPVMKATFGGASAMIA